MSYSFAEGRFYTCPVCRGRCRADTGLIANHSEGSARCSGSRQLPLEVEDGRSTATWADHYGPEFREYLLGKARKTRPTNPYKAEATRAGLIASFAPDKAVQGVYAALRTDGWTKLPAVALDADLDRQEARDALCRLRDIGIVYGRAQGWRLVDVVPDGLGELISAISVKARRRLAAQRGADTRHRNQQAAHAAEVAERVRLREERAKQQQSNLRPAMHPDARADRLRKLEAIANHPSTNPNEAANARRLVVKHRGT